MSPLIPVLARAFADAAPADAAACLDRVQRTLDTLLAQMSHAPSESRAEIRRLALLLQTASAFAGRLPGAELLNALDRADVHSVRPQVGDGVDRRYAVLPDVAARGEQGLAGSIGGWIDAQQAQQQIDVRREVLRNLPGASAKLPAGDPFEPLTAAEFGRRLGGLSEDEVLARERDRALFSVSPPARSGRSYPAFQTWSGIAGDPLQSVLLSLGDWTDGSAAYWFFSVPAERLSGLTPVEALAGRLTLPRDVAAEGFELLKSLPYERLRAVLLSARDHTGHARAGGG